jgi:RimJ/RimL family protein N-acetyltransferase
MKSPSPILENDLVKLEPLSLANYHYLLPIARQEKLVQYSPSHIETAEALKSYVEEALEKERNFLAMPFIIYDKTRKAYAGSTRYMNIDHKNKVLEIGSTWIGREFQGTGLNGEAKLLMLNYAFDGMHFEKVEFRIDERNLRSQKAVEKLGVKLEGVLRKNVYLLDGFKRNTCCYGILKEEWC